MAGELPSSSAESQKFIDWFVLLAELILVIACFGIAIAYIVRDIREAWRRANPYEPNLIVDDKDVVTDNLMTGVAVQAMTPATYADSVRSPVGEDSKQNDT